jgi:hypothetical protein
MKKNAFIPKTYRPTVPGSKLENLNVDFESSEYSPTQYTTNYAILISAKDDIVPYYFLKEINTRISIKHLFYEELGTNWDFAFSKGNLKILVENFVINPTAIYHRHPGISKEHPYYHKHVAFFEILDIWKGNLIGQIRDHYHNSSKAYQGITSIKNASKSTQNQIVKYPRSFFLKGDISLLHKKFSGSLVVKSCSNIRSKVVSEEIFKQWDMQNIHHLPTFFQERIDGLDIRVHVCGNTIWSLLVENKNCIDYRYATKGTVRYRHVELSNELNTFAKAVAKYESNQFIGIDLLQRDNNYYCLESNPGPGWSTFNHPSKASFAMCVLQKLLRRKS